MTTRTSNKSTVTPGDSQTKEDKRAAAAARRKAKEQAKADAEELRKTLEKTALSSAANPSGVQGSTASGTEDDPVDIGGTGEVESPTVIEDSARKDQRPADNQEESDSRHGEKQPEDSPETKKSKTSVETPIRSAIKQGRYRPNTPAPRRMHLHEHKRAIIEAGLALDSANKFETLVSAISSLITYCQMVDDHFVINPITDGGRTSDWSDPKQVPTSMKELGAFLKISGSPRLFDKQKGGPGKTGNKAPVVYFSFAVSSDIPPDDIMARVNVDWNILGGTRLAVKNLGGFDTVTPLVIYFLWNEGHGPTILRELQHILSSVSTTLLGGEQAPLPPMALRKQIPRIPGQVTSEFQNLPFRAQMARRAWHIEVEKKHVEALMRLVEQAKKSGAIENMWGRQAHISESADNDTSPGELKRYIKFAQRHVNFHCSMTCDDLKGIVNLDATAPFHSVTTKKKVGVLSMRHVLLKKFRMSDGTSLIAEVHQRGPLGSVDVIIPNTPEAEAMILMMNRHFPAYCFYYLMGAGIDADFVKELIREACCPSLVSKINECTWDAEKKSIITAEQAEEEARLLELENAAWYKDEFGKHMVDKMKQLKKSYTDAEALYKLDGERSVKTLHARNDPEEAAAKKRKGGTTESIDSESVLSLDLDSDVSMDSASKRVDSPVGEVEADNGNNAQRVRWTSPSSADDSAPLPSAGGG